MLRDNMSEIETKQAKESAIRARVRWKQVGDKCRKQFFQDVRKKNANVVIQKLKNTRGEVAIKHNNLENICFEFYKDLYKGL